MRPRQARLQEADWREALVGCEGEGGREGGREGERFNGGSLQSLIRTYEAERIGKCAD